MPQPTGGTTTDGGHRPGRPAAADWFGTADSSRPGSPWPRRDAFWDDAAWDVVPQAAIARTRDVALDRIYALSGDVVEQQDWFEPGAPLDRRRAFEAPVPPAPQRDAGPTGLFEPATGLFEPATGRFASPTRSDSASLFDSLSEFDPSSRFAASPSQRPAAVPPAPPAPPIPAAPAAPAAPPTAPVRAPRIALPGPRPISPESGSLPAVQAAPARQGTPAAPARPGGRAVPGTSPTLLPRSEAASDGAFDITPRPGPASPATGRLTPRIGRPGGVRRVGESLAPSIGIGVRRTLREELRRRQASRGRVLLGASLIVPVLAGGAWWVAHPTDSDQAHLTVATDAIRQGILSGTAASGSATPTPEASTAQAYTPSPGSEGASSSAAPVAPTSSTSRGRHVALPGTTTSRSSAAAGTTSSARPTTASPTPTTASPSTTSPSTTTPSTTAPSSSTPSTSTTSPSDTGTDPGATTSTDPGTTAPRWPRHLAGTATDTTTPSSDTTTP